MDGEEEKTPEKTPGKRKQERAKHHNLLVHGKQFVAPNRS